VRHLAENEVDGVGGPLETIGETPLANLIARAMSSPFGVGGSAFRTVKDRTMLTDTVAFPAYTRKAIELAGPYDEELVRNQDDEYNSRLRSLGAKILLASDVRARYYSRGSVRSLWRQYFQYGLWKVRVMQKHPRQMQARHFVPAVFVSSLLLGISLGTFSTYARILLGAGLGLYLVANLSASALIALRPEDDTKDKLNSLLFFPLIFGVLHLSYGTGFLVGLLRFLHRWGDNGTGARSLQKFARTDQTMVRAKAK
jgi:hypothetical protein